MGKYPSLTAAEELDQWENLAQMDDCISNGRFVPEDLRAMVLRLRAAEATLSTIAGARILGTPDRTARAQVEALIDLAKLGLPGSTGLPSAVGLVTEEDAPIEIYQGPIAQGMRFVWMPHQPLARRCLEVTKVIPENSRHEAKIYTCEFGQKDTSEIWNDESRFREACIPVVGEIS